VFRRLRRSQSSSKFFHGAGSRLVLTRQTNAPVATPAMATTGAAVRRVFGSFSKDSPRRSPSARGGGCVDAPGVVTGDRRSRPSPAPSSRR